MELEMWIWELMYKKKEKRCIYSIVFIIADAGIIPTFIAVVFKQKIIKTWHDVSDEEVQNIYRSISKWA